MIRSMYCMFDTRMQIFTYMGSKVTFMKDKFKKYLGAQNFFCAETKIV